jgi:hypothetical protein
MWAQVTMDSVSASSGRDRNNASDTMSPPDDSSNNAKRKNDEGGSAQPRAKRNRYISIAWYDMCLCSSSNDQSNKKCPN